MAVAVSTIGALNVDAATLGESVAVAASDRTELKEARLKTESVAVAVSAKAELKAAWLRTASVAVAVSAKAELN